MLIPKDKEQITQRGSIVTDVEEQMENLKNGFPFLNVIEPATLNDGIVSFSQNEIDELVAKFDNSTSNGTQVVKFVPASGAASRMFQKLFAFLNESKEGRSAEELLSSPDHSDVIAFFDQLEKFAFYPELVQLLDTKMKNEGTWDHCLILKTLLGEEGLSYGIKPKGLLSFHTYADHARTPVEEHLREAISYAKDEKAMCRVHFTVSPEHLPMFKVEADKAMTNLKKDFDVEFDLSYSVQKPSTDTIAVTPENEPFRQGNGDILFRPGGHGALIENLNDITGADVVFIKNIDNVVPDHLKADTYTYKKVIGGYLLSLQEKMFDYLEMLDRPIGVQSSTELTEMMEFVQMKLCYKPALDPYYTDKEDLIELLKTIFDRPIRICGMVKNEGEPGGGPFWAKNSDGSVSLQVVEGAQVDKNDPSQMDIVQASTHFNPVDLVCGVKDRNGKEFDLISFRDPNTGFISHKSKEGRELKALELPGLWNGAMSNWSTIFVEVPISTFAPVKTVNDLLRPTHQ